MSKFHSSGPPGAASGIKISLIQPIERDLHSPGPKVDVSPAAMVGAVEAAKQANTTQEVQVAVMKKAMDMQGAGTLSLLQSVTGNLPLATSGSVGTQLNLLA